MKCVVCETDVPNSEWTCPRCGESVGQWREMDQTAAEFFSEGLCFVRSGEPLKAVISLVKASVLNPGSPEILKTIGLLLAQQGVYDTAAFYLMRSLNLADSLGSPADSGTKAALDEVRKLNGQVHASSCTSGLCKMPVPESSMGDNQPQEGVKHVEGVHGKSV